MILTSNPGALIDDAVYRTYWNDVNLSSAALFVETGVDVDTKINELREAFAGEAELVIRSSRGLREHSLAIFDRSFSITVALQMLATLVAFIGILSALMSLQLERRREIGTLRAVGMTRRQLWRLTLVETGLMGMTAGILAMPTGFVLAVISSISSTSALSVGRCRCIYNPFISYKPSLLHYLQHC